MRMHILTTAPLSAWFGILIVLINIVIIMGGGFLAPYGETEIVGTVWMPPDSSHWMGTDHLGRDLFSRMLYGARNTISLTILITCLSSVIGIFFGFLAAVRSGGWLDHLLSRLVDVMMAFPPLIFTLMMLSALGRRCVCWCSSSRS